MEDGKFLDQLSNYLFSIRVLFHGSVNWTTDASSSLRLAVDVIRTRLNQAFFPAATNAL
jgi:hypothetical protein